MYKAAIEIAAPPARIFEFLTDPKHLQSWQPDVVEAKPLPPGGLQVGAHVGADGDQIHVEAALGNVLPEPFSGLAAGVTAVLLTATLNSAAPNMANDYLLRSIAAVLLGMTMFEPGRCNVAGTLVGAATIGMLGNGLVLMGAEYYVQDIMLGVIIVASVALSASTLKKAAFSV